MTDTQTAPAPAPDVTTDNTPVARVRQRFSLRIRVMLLATICAGCAVALVSLGAFLTVKGNLYEQFDDALTQRAAAAVHSPTVGNQLQDIPAALLWSSDIQIGVLNATGSLLRPKQAAAPPWGPNELQVAVGRSEQSLRTDTGTDTRVVAMRWGSGEALVLAQSLTPLKRTLADLSLVLFLFGGSGVIVAAVAGTAVARAALRPVERLTSATERVTRSMDLRPIPVTGDDELARMTQSFNTMLRAVSDSQERQRQLVADAGHELRTPLTSLRTNLELLLSASKAGAPPLPEEDRADIEADIRGQLDELTQLIGDLVELAREDEPRTAAERVDMIEVVDRALDRARRRAGEIEFATELEPWVLTGDPGVLERAVLNLLDNAVKFSPSPSTVRVKLRALGDGTAVVEVIDSGPGIAPEDLPKVFERFYRSSEARTLPGSGLGLAIVKQAAERHGGTVYAGTAAEGGAVMTIRLPGVPGAPG